LSLGLPLSALPAGVVSFSLLSIAGGSPVTLPGAAADFRSGTAPRNERGTGLRGAFATREL
ncbi:hypothetical protein ACFCXH_24835, partial [Streptomyces nojiriensis]|uniref:hypothetical protein n=1 Tax=Streptomyces nojiriensis TaxID=66374 RepID=UPI0035DB356D